MYESRLDDFLPTVRGGQAVLLRGARGEAGRAQRRQKGDVEPRVEASVYVRGCVGCEIGVEETKGRARTYEHRVV